MTAVAGALPYVVAAFLLCAGWYGMATSRNLLHLVTCLSVLHSSTYLLLLGVGYRAEGTAPIYDDVPVGTPGVDPVVQALAVTDIVVGAAVLALLLALVMQVHKRHGTIDPQALRGMDG
ncbi:MAG TPA: NADH-quinone oxidoreductase subunit K [Egibacteraceae bacterium]|nr:NADH-quinone oxidoreductase subunit K [Egibacteraceae bacterium]